MGKHAHRRPADGSHQPAPSPKSPGGGGSQLPPATDAIEAETLIKTEYDFLRHEVAESLKESANLEKLAAGATGATWAWLLTHPDVPRQAFAIPMLFVLLGGTRSLTLYRSVGFIAAYLRQREQYVARERPEGAGWETYRGAKSAGVFATALAFWVLLLALSATVWWLSTTDWWWPARLPATSPAPVICCTCPSAASPP